jgi:hypothetical protein
MLLGLFLPRSAAVDFALHRTIAEKYNVVNARSNLAGTEKYDYQSNEIGFGWINAAFLVLYEEMSASAKAAFSGGPPRISGRK